MNLIVIAVINTVLVGFFRAVALRRHWFDLPNARSSHQQPVPRGAGFVFVVVIAVSVLLYWFADGDSYFVASLASGLAVATAGWWDDVHTLSARARFSIYGFAAAIAVAVILHTNAGYQIAALPLQIVVVFGVALALLWWINLYNFMDGINGIAALEGVFIMLAAMALSLAQSSAPVFGFYAVVAAALVGFLPWNFPVARVFMGDVGSAFLGFVIGVLGLWSILSGALSLWQWLILGGVFIVDASYTLAIRLLTGQRWHEAHRSHAYQRLADRCGSHTVAVMILMAINIGWLLPLAWVATNDSWRGTYWLLLAWSPLVVSCRVLRAGCAAPVLRT